MPAHAGEFTSAEFVKWERAAQQNYFRIAIGMAAAISRANDGTHGACIEDWYLKNREKAESRLLGVMNKYPAYHPRGVILAVLEKACGSFTYKVGRP